MKKLTVLVPILALITAIVMSCGEEPRHRGITDENQRTHVDSVIFSAFDTRDIPRTLAVIDSVEKKGELSKVRGLFYRTISYNSSGQYRKSLNLYYKLADVSASELEDQGDFECYNYTCKDYLRLLCHMKRYDEVLREANVFDKNFQAALNDIHNMLKIHHAPLDFRESQHTMKSVALAYIQAGNYAEALPWVERQDSLFAIASNRSDRDTIYIDEMKADICYCRALLEHKRGGSIAAERAYRDYLSTRTSKRLGHIINSTEYLMLTERYEDAADHYQLLHRYMQESAFETDLENIGRYLLPKYRANLFAGRKDSALSVASQIAEAYDSALVRQKRTDAILLSTIYETDAKERQLAEQQAQHLQYCLYGVIAVLLLIIVFLAIYAYRLRKA